MCYFVSIVGVCTNGAIRLRVVNDDSVPQMYRHYLIEDRLSVGRLDVCQNRRFEAVCKDTVTMTDASVACTQLGFSPYGIYDIVLLQLACFHIWRNIVVISTDRNLCNLPWP